ncbi:MAG TPA: pyrimidine 5'-nucleotidase [Magnetospirillaceae bacterium]|jgi:putative hydrolase of the HAD superfamily
MWAMNDPHPILGGATRRGPLSAIDTWLFDLDNTLYSSASDVFPQIHRNMLSFIVQLLGVSEDEAKLHRSRMYRQYGTTMRGMMVEHGVDPHAFMDHVHAIDLGCIDPAPQLGAAIARLPGRKIIFTNGSRHHATNVLNRLGIAGHFDAVFDVEDCDWLPKPDATGYTAIVARHGIAPERAAMIDDIPHNLAPASALGMTTVWVREGTDIRWKDQPPEHDHIDHVTGDLLGWLEAVPVSK